MLQFQENQRVKNSRLMHLILSLKWHHYSQTANRISIVIFSIVSSGSTTVSCQNRSKVMPYHHQWKKETSKVCIRMSASMYLPVYVFRYGRCHFPHTNLLRKYACTWWGVKIYKMAFKISQNYLSPFVYKVLININIALLPS